MKKMLTGLLAITSLLAYADEAILEADFNTPGDFTLKNLGESLKSFTPTEGRISFPGKKGTGMLSATQHLEDFLETNGVPQKSLRFTKIQGFPQEKGALEVWLQPYFNEDIKPGKVPHNYCFRFFGFQKVKRVLTVFITSHKTLVCQFELEDGKKAYLYHTTKNWQPKQWVRLNLVWTPAEKKMYVNGVLVASKKVTGNLQEIDSLELGAIDTYEPFQGVIDEFKVTAEPPAGLKESVPAKKTKRSSSPVFRASSAGLNG